MAAYSILLVDDHLLFREGLKLLLGISPSIGEIYQASSGEECLNLLESVFPDVVLMDIEMPGIDGIETTRKALIRYPTIKVIALSMFGDEVYYLRMIEAGAKGFILKNSDIEVVLKAIEDVIDGQNYFSSEVMANLVLHLNKRKNSETRNELTERETEILYLICKGMSNQEIALMLNLSKRTVDKHRENLLLKTDSKNTAGLVMFAIKNGVISV